MTPVAPADLVALVPSSGDTLCQAIIKYIKFMIRFIQWFGTVADNNGNMTGGFAADVCTVRANCPPPS